MWRLISHLPRESATSASVHGPKVLWGPAEHLLAAAVNVLNQANWQRGGGKGSRPDPIKAPGSDDRRKTTLTAREIELRLVSQQQRAR